MAVLISAGIAAAGSVISGYLHDLSQKGLINAQQEAVITTSRLNILTQQQQQNLAVSLQQAKNDQARLQIIVNAITQIQIAENQTSQGGNFKVAIIIVSVGFGLVILAIVLKKLVLK